MATKQKVLTKQEQKQMLTKQVTSSEQRLDQLTAQNAEQMANLKELKEERERLEKDLRELNVIIRDTLSSYETTLDQRNKAQAEINRYNGEIAALGE